MKKLTARLHKRWLIPLGVAVIVLGIVIAVVLNRRGKPVAVYPVANLAGTNAVDGTLLGSVSTGQAQNVILRDAQVKKVNVKKGDTVTIGDVLMTYDPTKFELTILSDQAHIAVLERTLRRAERELEHLQGLTPAAPEPEPQMPKAKKVDRGPLKLVERVDQETAFSTDGDYDRRYLCTPSTLVTADFLTWVRDQYKSKDDPGLSLEFRIYHNDTLYGSWVLTSEELATLGETDSYTVYTFPEGSHLFVDTQQEGDGSGPADSGIDDPSASDPSAGDSGTGGSSTDDSGTGDSGTGDSGSGNPSADGSGSSSSDTTTPSREEVSLPDGLYTKVTEPKALEDWTLGTGISCEENGAVFDPFAASQGAVYGSFFSTAPTPYERYEYIQPEPSDLPDEPAEESYTAEELAQMIKEQQETIKTTQLDLREARVTYEQDKLVGDSGEVKAQVSGVVEEVRDLKKSKVGDTVISVRGGKGCVVTLYVDELSLSSIEPGALYTVTDWETGASAEATVTEIGDTPASGQWSYTISNPNTSWYPLTAEVSADMLKEQGLTMNVGDSLEAVSLDGGQENGQDLYLDPMYIRKDEKGSYVLVAGDDGRLEKRYVSTGVLLWGAQLQITSGLSMDDHIAFPYGTDVVEGAQTVEAEYPEELY